MLRHGRTFVDHKKDPSDEELLLDLVLGLSEALSNPREEHDGCTNSLGISHHLIRRLMKLLIVKCELPIPESRADDFILWQQHADLEIDQLLMLSKYEKPTIRKVLAELVEVMREKK